MTRHTRERYVDAARERAQAALGAYLADQKFTLELERLVHLATVEYKRRFPDFAKIFRRSIEPWLFYDGDPTTARIARTHKRSGGDGVDAGPSRRGAPKRVDVFCLFCRVMLVPNALWQFDYGSRLRPHTTVCALRCLAGLMEPGEPGTYKLPSDLNP